jgi:hypothetical protein
MKTVDIRIPHHHKKQKVIFLVLIICFVLVVVSQALPISINNIFPFLQSTEKSRDHGIKSVSDFYFESSLIDDSKLYSNLGFDLSTIDDVVIYNKDCLVEGHLPLLIKANEDFSLSKTTSFLSSKETSKQAFGNIDYKYKILQSYQKDIQVPIYENKPYSIDVLDNKTGKTETIKYNESVITGYKPMKETRYHWVETKDMNSVSVTKDGFIIVDIVGKFKAGLGKKQIDVVPEVTVDGVKYEFDQYAWWSTSWNYSKPITINHLQVHAALSNFPVLINITDTDLKDNAQADGDDIAFVSSNNATQYNHEIEKYTSGTGKLVAWVNVTSLSNTTDTIIWMYYGNGGCSSQQHATATWHTNYMAVYHMGYSSGIQDSTANNRDATRSGNTATQTDKFFGDCQLFTGDWSGSSSTYITTDGAWFDTADTSVTWSCWVYNKGITYDYGGYMQPLSGTSGVKWFCLVSGTYGFNIWNGGGTVNAGAGHAQWRYITNTRNGQTINAYSNGTLKETNTDTENDDPSGSTKIRIGPYATSGNPTYWMNTFGGWIEEYRVSSVIWSDAWICTEFNSMKNASNGSFFSVGSEHGTSPTSSVDSIIPYWCVATKTITATTQNGSATNISLYYRYSSDNVSWGGYCYFGIDSASPFSFNFNFPNGTGYYQFYSIAKKGAYTESSPAANDTGCAYETNTISITEPFPVNGATGVSVAGSPLNVNVTHSLNFTMNVSVYSNHTGTWTKYASFGGYDFMLDFNNDTIWNYLDLSKYISDVGWQRNGLYGFYLNASVTAEFGMTAWNRKYYWSVNVTDEHGLWKNETFFFHGENDTTKPTSQVNETLGYWKNFHWFMMGGNASDTESGIDRTELWYRYSADNISWGAWTLGYTDTTNYDNPAWLFDFDTHGDIGYYQFYTRAWDNASNYEDAPGVADYICGFDDSPPTSFIEPVSPYWYNSQPVILTVNWSETGVGIDYIRLWVSTDGGSSWYGYLDVNSTPWQFSFDMPEGEEEYWFYSIAVDNATNTEAAPGGPDTFLGYDITKPTSSITLASYWFNSPVNLNGIASDVLSGINKTEWWYRYSADNISWGAWTLGSNDTTHWDDPYWYFDFDLYGGEGYYQFYTRAKDNATNYEDAPGAADAICGYAPNPPTSSVNLISPYFTNVDINIYATASDGLSGLKLVEFWYKFSTDNFTWGAGTLYYTHHFPWMSGLGCLFTMANDGYYQFYTIAETNASVREIPLAPIGGWPARVARDTQAPGSWVNDTLLPDIITTVPFTVTANALDAWQFWVVNSGVKDVRLYYQYAADGYSWGAWTYYGINTTGKVSGYDSTWNWSFMPVGLGSYRFSAVAKDNAGNMNEALWNEADCNIYSFCFANFTYTITGKVAQFNDTSLGTMTNWYWEYGDGYTDWGERNPEHYYYGTGNFSVTLTVEDLDSHTLSSVTKTITFAAIPTPPETYLINFNWFDFMMPMVFIIIIIMLFIVLFAMIKRSGGKKR